MYTKIAADGPIELILEVIAQVCSTQFNQIDTNIITEALCKQWLKGVQIMRTLMRHGFWHFSHKSKHLMPFSAFMTV